MKNKDKFLRQSFLAVLACVVLSAVVGCGGNGMTERMDRISQLMEAYPDSALAALDSIDADRLIGREEKSRYALLYSMALDKNYIDLTDDSLINVALRWYSGHGAADDRLKAWYYQGRVYGNAGDNEKAMASFAKAEEYVDGSRDYAAIGRLYNAKSRIYSDVFDLERSAENAVIAAENYLKAKDYDKYAGCLCNAANKYMIMDSLDVARSYLDKIKEYWDEMHGRTRSWYFETLIYLECSVRPDKVQESIVDYIRSVSFDQIDWLALSDIYCQRGMADSALSAIHNYEKCWNSDSESAYYVALSTVYDSLGLYDKALDAYKNYLNIVDSVNLEILDSDIRFVEERHSKDMEILKRRNRTTVLSLELVIVVLLSSWAGFILWSRLRKAALSRKLAEEEKEKMRKAKEDAEEETRRYEELYSSVVAERDELKASLEDLPDEEVRSKVTGRLRVLDKFIAAHLSGNMEGEARKELDSLLSDRDSFLESTRLLFALSHPGFIAYLKGKGLSSEEAGICCMYVMGLHGKEIGNYLGRKGYYNKSSEIRRKLGLDAHGQHIDGFLRDILEKTDAKA